MKIENPFGAEQNNLQKLSSEIEKFFFLRREKGQRFHI